MENFSPDQYERFEAYRRHALPKQAVKKARFIQYPTLFSCADHFLGYTTNYWTASFTTRFADRGRFC